ncbi:MAG: hypothetical protein COT14_04030, partial [Candidatus Diapherotrites archaeon CG08_land_8_20_14_0_20_30_16]
MIFDNKIMFLFLIGIMFVLFGSAFGIGTCRSYINTVLLSEGCQSIINTNGSNTIDGFPITYSVGSTAYFPNITLPNGYTLSFTIEENFTGFARYLNAFVNSTVKNKSGDLVTYVESGIDYDTASKNTNTTIYLDDVPALKITSTDMGTPEEGKLYLSIIPIESWLKTISTDIAKKPNCIDNITLTLVGCILANNN